MSEPRWAHQEEAFRFVEKLYRAGRRGALLAICMGGGKSRVAIDLANEFDCRTPLILAPLRVIAAWERQFERFAPGHWNFLALDDRIKNVAEKTRRAEFTLAWAQSRGQRLAIGINYESARTEPFASWALRRPWPLVIADESHRLRQPGGRTSRWCAKLGMRSHLRLALTGTPMPHEPTDVWGQFRFVDPRHLDETFSGFRDRYAILDRYFHRPITWRNLEELNRRFYELAFRVDESVLDLPEALDQTLECDFTPNGRRIYQEMDQEMVAWVAANFEVTAANALARMTRLQQITGGSLPDEQDVPQPVDDAKEQLLGDFFEDLGDEPAVVFAKFKPDLAAIHRAAEKQEIRSGELSGAADDLAAWQRGGEGAPTVLAAQIQAGSTGIDLTRARIAVYYSLGFSLGDYLQSRARILRPPQKRPVVFYHLQVRNSIDQYILAAVERREDLIDYALNRLRQRARAADGDPCLQAQP